MPQPERDAMFANERRNYIKKLILQNKKIEVFRLSTQLGVSEVTIRKDLEYLENTGFLIRTHGGAVLNEAFGSSGDNGSDLTPQHIQTISNTASCLIDNGDLIYLGADTLCTAIAQKLLQRQMLTIITNNLAAAETVSEYPNIKTIVPGGDVGKERDTCLLKGEQCRTFLETIHYDKAIFGVDALKFSSGFMMRDSDSCGIYRSVWKQADQKIIIAPSDVFNKNAFYPVAGLDEAHIIVSDEKMPEDYMNYFAEHNIKVFTTYNFDLN